MQRAMVTISWLCLLANISWGQSMQFLQTEDKSWGCVSTSGYPLVHTTQLTADESQLAQADGLAQLEATLHNVDRALQQSGSSLADAVKLNVYVHPEQPTELIRSKIEAHYSPEKRPAIAIVHTQLPAAGQLIAMDAVGVARQAAPASGSAVENRSAWQVGAVSSLCPLGPRVYISGQAERGDNSLANATTETLKSLENTLKFLKLDKQQVLQIKCFLNPMSQVAEAVQALKDFYGASPLPPCSFVQWQSDLPIEIEMIAMASERTGERTDAALEVLTPPGMTTPAVYCRLMIARHPTTIYTDGLYPADPASSGEAQLRSLFANLKRLLDLSQSDWMHLVKATYYVSNSELSDWHNRVRPDYFSPRRPPAASKAAVSGVGSLGHGIMMDMIVVPGD